MSRWVSTRRIQPSGVPPATVGDVRTPTTLPLSFALCRCNLMIGQQSGPPHAPRSFARSMRTKWGVVPCSVGEHRPEPEHPARGDMAYVENGVLKSKRTIWRLSIISDFFLAIINFVKVFFGTLFSVEKSDQYKKSGKKWDGGPGGGSGGGPYGGGGGPGGPRPRTMSDLRADHNALPACGSCCGGG